MTDPVSGEWGCPEGSRGALDHPGSAGTVQRRRSSGGLRNTRPRGATPAARRQAQAGQPLEHPPDGGVRLEPREVHAEADVGAGGEGDVEPRVVRRTSNVSGSGNTAGSRFAAAMETTTSSRAPIRRAAELTRRAWRSGPRPRPPARAAATPRRRSAAGPAPPRTAPSAAGAASRWATALAIIPSVVSMPPNSSTAAFDATRRARAAGPPGRGRHAARTPGSAWSTASRAARSAA